MTTVAEDALRRVAELEAEVARLRSQRTAAEIVADQAAEIERLRAEVQRGCEEGALLAMAAGESNVRIKASSFLAGYADRLRFDDATSDAKAVRRAAKLLDEHLAQLAAVAEVAAAIIPEDG